MMAGFSVKVEFDEEKFHEAIEEIKKNNPDLVVVVRCKDCVNFEARAKSDGEYGYCWHWDFEQGMSPNEVFANDFCSYGERKEVSE